MREKILGQYGVMAKEMEALRSAGAPSPRYHVMADALYWEDEIPKSLSDFSGDCLRFVLRYRTSLIQGKEEEKWRDYWLEARRQFPDWIGFVEHRCRPGKELLATYEALRREAMSNLPGLGD